MTIWDLPAADNLGKLQIICKMPPAVDLGTAPSGNPGSTTMAYMLHKTKACKPSSTECHRKLPAVAWTHGRNCALMEYDMTKESTWNDIATITHTLLSQASTPAGAFPHLPTQPFCYQPSSIGLPVSDLGWERAPTTERPSSREDAASASQT